MKHEKSENSTTVREGLWPILMYFFRAKQYVSESSKPSEALNSPVFTLLRHK